VNVGYYISVHFLDYYNPARYRRTPAIQISIQEHAHRTIIRCIGKMIKLNK
jgi:hypothetical protein